MTTKKTSAPDGTSDAANSITGQSALDLADAIERGEVEMLTIRSKSIVTASDEALRRLVGS